MDIKAFVPSVTLTNTPESKIAKNGVSYWSFTIATSKNAKYRCVCFNDENTGYMYRRIAKLKLKEGSVVNIQATLEKQVKLIAINDEEIEVEIPLFKITDIDYAIPISFIKKQEEGTESATVSPTEEHPSREPLCNLDRFEGGE